MINFFRLFISRRSERRGFTLIEGLLALTVISLVGGITVPMYLNYQINNDLSLAMEQATQGLRRAQTLSQSGNGDSVWGFFVPAGTLYKGSSYATRDQSVDEVYPMPSTITVSGSILEVSYSREGVPDRTGTITLTDLTGRMRLISIFVPEVGIPVNTSDFISICHHTGNGEMHNITVSESALPAHQNHGDTIGACPASSASSSSVSSVASSVSSAASSSSSSVATGACADRFVLSSDDTITATGPVSAVVDVLGSEITYGEGGPEINVYVSYSKNGGSSWSDLYHGRDVDGGETQTVTGIVAGNQIRFRARGYYRRNGWLTFDRTYETPDASGHLAVLRDGDTPPDYPAFDDQESLAAFLADVLDPQGNIDIGPYELVVIGELGVQNLQSDPDAVDFQDVVLRVQFTQAEGACS